MAKIIIAKSNRGTPELIGIHNIAGDIIDPSTEPKQDDMIALLDSIEQNTEDMDISLDTLVIETQEINLNTDDLENQLQDVKTLLTSISATGSTESSLVNVLNAIGEASGDNLLLQLQTINTELGDINVALSDVATETTLQTVAGNIIDVEGKLDSVITELESINLRLDVDLSSRASESTSLEIRDTIGQETGKSVIGVLSDIWDKLVSLFEDGVAKLKIWDGTNTAGVTTANRLKVENVSLNNPLEGYEISDIDETADPSYYGFINKDGNYYILRINDGSGTVRYSAGTEDYTTAWGNKPLESYDYFYEEF